MPIMRRGYTLIELVITIVIIAIMAASTFISIESYKSLRLDAAAKKIAADLDYARNLAISTAQWYCVDFTVDPNNLYTVSLAEQWGDQVIDDPSAPGKPLVVNLNDSYNGVRIIAVSLGIAPDNNDVYFSPLGSPHQWRGGPVFPVGVSGQISLQYGNDAGLQKTIEITPNTGRISIN